MPAIRDSVWVATSVATGTTLVLQTPVNVAGDVLLAIVMADTGAGTWTSPGWTSAPGSPLANTAQLMCMWKVSSGAEPATHTFTSTSSESYNGVMLAIQDANTTTPFGSPAVVNFATQAAAAKFAMQSITTNVANALIIYASANSGLGVPSLLEGPVFGLVGADGQAESLGVGWGFKAAAGATPTNVTCSNVATGAGVKLALQIAPPAGGATVIPAYCADDTSTYLNPINGTTAYNGDTAFAATADTNFGTTLGGITAADATVSAATDAGINSFHSTGRLTSISGSQNLSGAELVFAVANQPDLTGKNLLCHVGPSTEGQTQRFSTVASGRGIWMGVRNAAGNNKIWQVYGRELGALRQQPVVINTAALNTKHSAGTLVPTAVQAVGFWVAGTGVSTTLWDFCSLWALGTTTICGGSAATPITVEGIVAAAAEGKERRSVLRQGSRQMLSYQALQLGNGSDPLFVDLGESAIEFPRQYNAALKAVTYNSVDDVCGITFWPAAGQTVDLSNAVFSSPSKYHWRWHASASTAATINTAGLQVIGAGDCQLRALPFTRVTFGNCPAITQNGATLSLCNFSNSTITANNPGLISGCSFTQGAAAGHAIVITAPGTYTFSANQFSGYGADGSTSAAIHNTVAGGGGGATYVVSENTTANFTGVQDSALREANPTQNTGFDGTGETSAIAAARQHVVLRFSGLASVPAGVISAAEVRLYCAVSTGAKTVSLHRLLAPLNVDQVSWADRQTATPWTVGGALGDGSDRVAAASATLSVPDGAENVYYVWSGAGVVADVEFWRANPAQNYGWLAVVDGAAGAKIAAWRMSEGADGTRPELRVTTGGGGPTVTLNISGGGSTPTVRNGAGASTVVNNTINLTLAGVVSGSDIVILAAGTTTILHQVDAHAGTSYVYTYSGASTVDIGILKQGMVPLYVRGFALPATDSSLPINQVSDRNYL